MTFFLCSALKLSVHALLIKSTLLERQARLAGTKQNGETMTKLYAASVLMQKVEGPRLNTKSVLSVVRGVNLDEAKEDAEKSARAALPDMKVIEVLAVQVPDSEILAAAAELS